MINRLIKTGMTAVTLTVTGLALAGTAHAQSLSSQAYTSHARATVSVTAHTDDGCCPAFSAICCPA